MWEKYCSHPALSKKDIKCISQIIRSVLKTQACSPFFFPFIIFLSTSWSQNCFSWHVWPKMDVITLWFSVSLISFYDTVMITRTFCTPQGTNDFHAKQEQYFLLFHLYLFYILKRSKIHCPCFESPSVIVVTVENDHVLQTGVYQQASSAIVHLVFLFIQRPAILNSQNSKVEGWSDIIGLTVTLYSPVQYICCLLCFLRSSLQHSVLWVWRAGSGFADSVTVAFPVLHIGIHSLYSRKLVPAILTCRNSAHV